MGLRSTATTVVATVDEGGDGRQTDGPTAEHRDALADLDLGLVGRVHADGQGLDEGGHIQGHIGGNLMEAVPIGLGDEQQRGQSAFGCTVADPADHVVPGLHDDPIADPRRRHVGPDPLDDSRHLVAETHGAPPGPASPPIAMYERSLPQTPHAATRTTASRGPGSGWGPRRPGRHQARGPAPAALRTLSSRRRRNKNAMASRMAASTTSTRTPRSLR